MGEDGDLDLDLEAVTEFLVLIAALCELKSRLLLPSEDVDAELGPQEAADELLARMLEYRRYSQAAQMLSERFEREGGVMYRSAPLPAELRRAALDAATQAYEPDRVGLALGDLLTIPPPPDTRHIRTTVLLQRRLGVVRDLLRSRKTLDFDEAVRQRGPLHPGGAPSSPCSSCIAGERRPGRRRRHSAGSRCTPNDATTA